MRLPVNPTFGITTLFGVPDSNAKFGRHSGIDYSVPTGRSVYAPTSGTITNIVSPTGGNMVVLFSGGLWHRLMHNSSFSRPNGPVSEGEEVAKAGSTGLSTGPHVHWDINNEGVYPTSFAAFINPADWLEGDNMALTPSSQDKFIKMGLRRPPTEAELNNQDWANDPNLLADALWSNGGEASYNESQNPPEYVETKVFIKKGQ